MNPENPFERRMDTLDGVVVLDSTIHRDRRGQFRELYRESRFVDRTGLSPRWMQESVSVSRRGVIRGLHVQTDPPQAKLVSCLSGDVFDVVVDLRRSSPNRGRWMSRLLSDENGRQIWIPEGFGHGFQVLSESATVHYKASAEYAPGGTVTVAWNDPSIGVEWPILDAPVLSDADRNAPLLNDAQLPQ